MKKNNLPYIPLDEEYSLNFAILAIAISILSHSKKGVLSLDINKIQIFYVSDKKPIKNRLCSYSFGEKTCLCRVPVNLYNKEFFIKCRYLIRQFQSEISYKNYVIAGIALS
nr:hypothetical protein [Escherichia sp. E2562]